MYKVICHCGNVELSFKKLPDTYTVCNCSICRRYGVKWIYFTVNEVSIKEKIPTTEYIWGDKMIAFHHCPTCGCVSHYTGVIDSEFDRVAINANLLEDPQLLDELAIRKFNGADRKGKILRLLDFENKLQKEPTRDSITVFDLWK